MAEVLALIPARGGSKGIPRKNIRSFAGFPLLAWSIAAGLQAQSVTRVIVSTDDEQIAEVGRQFGAETPFLRPAEYAQDDSTDLPLFQHALEWLGEQEGYRPEVVVQLRPTSPLRPNGLVDRAIQVLAQHPDASSVRGVVPAGQNPHKMWRLPKGETGPMINLLTVEGLNEPYNASRQHLPAVYWQTGHIDAIRASTIREKGSVSGDRIYPLVIDARYTVDIDNLGDWVRYEHLVLTGGLDLVSPGRPRRKMPTSIKLLVLDFDGVVTDNRVWTDENGREMVASLRSDSLRLKTLREAGVETMILSSEPNTVVSMRAKKMGIEAIHGIGIEAKGQALERLMQEKNVAADETIFVGNDLNDLPCFEIAGWAVAVADAYPEVLRAADCILSRAGGKGAVREICDLIMNTIQEKNHGS